MLHMNYANATDLVARGRASVEADPAYQDPVDLVAAQDVLTNIAHYIRSLGADPADVWRRALRNYDAECSESV